MSSDKLHIDRSNYEEYFLFYLDGELSNEDRVHVEKFAALYPDLQQELTLLLSTQLENETFSFDHKEELYAGNIKLQMVDESLLLYIDNELTGKEKTVLVSRIEKDALLKKQYHQLQSAKLNTGDIIKFPDKKKLFHHEKRRAVSSMWFRVAAAVAILLGTGLFWLAINDNKEIPAVTYNQTIKTLDTLSKPSQKLIKDENPSAPTVAKNTESEKNIKPPISSSINKVFVDAQKKKAFLTNPEKDLAKEERSAPVINKSPELTQAVPTPLLQDINTSVVTTKVSPPYNQIEANVIPSMVKNTAAFENDGDKKGSVRGFLRKASRFIERRTGINPLNDDKELYVGVVAIKL
jgi:hypothetical protein